MSIRAAEAREVVEKLKYPPVGHRSVGGWGPHYQLAKLSTGEAVKALNAANLTVVMLETPTAIANAAEIAAVPGVDVLLIGSNDLCAEMGIPGDFGNDRLAEAYRTMIAACARAEKFPGMAGIYNEAIMPRYIEMGARFILSGQDASFMLAGSAVADGVSAEDAGVASGVPMRLVTGPRACQPARCWAKRRRRHCSRCHASFVAPVESGPRGGRPTVLRIIAVPRSMWR